MSAQARPFAEARGAVAQVKFESWLAALKCDVRQGSALTNSQNRYIMVLDHLILFLGLRMTVVTYSVASAAIVA